MIKKWFNRRTPFLIFSLIALPAILHMLLINRKANQVLKYSLIFKTYVLLMSIIIIDMFLKYSITGKNCLIWIIKLFRLYASSITGLFRNVFTKGHSLLTLAFTKNTIIPSTITTNP